MAVPRCAERVAALTRGAVPEAAVLPETRLLDSVFGAGAHRVVFRTVTDSAEPTADGFSVCVSASARVSAHGDDVWRESVGCAVGVGQDKDETIRHCAATARVLAVINAVELFGVSTAGLDRFVPVFDGVTPVV